MVQRKMKQDTIWNETIIYNMDIAVFSMSDGDLAEVEPSKGAVSKMKETWNAFGVSKFKSWGALYKCEFNTRVTCLHLNCWISSCWLWARVRGVIRRKPCANLTSLHGSARKLVGLVNHQVAVGIQSARGAYWIETWPHPKSFRDLTLWELSTGIVPRECCFERFRYEIDLRQPVCRRCWLRHQHRRSKIGI